MNDLISRKAVLEKAVEVRGYISKMVSSYDIATAPAVEADPVKHGRWVELPMPRTMWKYRCDKCGCPQDYKHNYCPNCGAKMDGGNENA